MVEEEIDDDFEDGSVDEPTEAVPQESNVPVVDQEEQDDDFEGGSVDEPTEALPVESNVAIVKQEASQNPDFSKPNIGDSLPQQ